MPEATVEFVQGTNTFVVPVHVEGFVSAQDHVFASITSVPNVNVIPEQRENGVYLAHAIH